MEGNTIYLLFSVLRSVFHSNQMSDADKNLVTSDSLKDVIKLATKHDIAHLVALGIVNNGLVDEDKAFKAQLQQITFRAVYRYEKLNYELKQVCDVLDKAEIPFIPLKGSVIRKYYPEPWMRTSCDIDVLIHEKDLRTAVSYLIENLKYTEHEQKSHDISLFSPNGVHLELHYNLIEDGRVNNSSRVLSNVWETAERYNINSMRYQMSDEMFYFYQIAHMAKHFENGGCGIRPFIDLWILDNIFRADKISRDKLLEAGGLLHFSGIASKLASCWLDNLPMDSVCEKMQNYILSGGVYGTHENFILVQQQKKGGKIKYALSKIIIPYDTIKFHYPILQKHRWLTPIMQIRRWFKLLFCGHAKRSMRELSYNSNISKSQANEMKTLLDEIRL